MTLPGKYFDVVLLALFIVCVSAGCQDKKKPSAEPAAPPKAAPAEIEEEPIDPKAALEVACFEGDQDACDQLGH